MVPPPLIAAVIAASLFAHALPAQLQAVHVSPDGDDRDSGGIETPVRTPARAQAIARKQADRGVSTEVVLHAGTWYLDAPLQFGSEDGGTATRTVTWLAAPGDIVTLSGGMLVTGFEVEAGGAWVAQLPAAVGAPSQVRELFVDGERRPRALTPNDGYLRIDQAAADRRSGFTFTAGDLPALSAEDLKQVELLFLHDWSVSRVGVRSLDLASRTLSTTDPIGCAAPHFAIDNFEPHPRYRLENAREFLDQPGEWCFDSRTRQLRYLPMPGELPANVTVVVPVLPALVQVRGGDEPVRNLHFVGLRFEHCAWFPPAHGYAEGQANFHEPRDGGILRGRLPAAITFDRAEDCSLRTVQVAHIGGAGIALGNRCARCSVSDSIVEDIAGNGVMIGETGDRTVAGKPWWQQEPGQATRDVTVSGCSIARCGQQFGGAVGIWVGFAWHCRIVGNDIHHLPYTGVSLGWMWNATPTPCGAHLVEGNEIHHVMQLLSDGGGIYTLGLQPGTVLRKNRIHDIPVNLGRAQSNGMFLDEGTTGIVIEQNTIWNVDRSPLRFHRAGKNQVRDNVLLVRDDNAPVTYNSTAAADIQFTDNVVAKQTGKL